MKKILLFITIFLLIFGLNSSAFAFVNFTKSPNFLLDEDYDMIIISPSVFSIELQPLIDHKNSRSIDTILITVEEIYLSYPGRDKPEQIKYFIKHALDNWNIEYVLLVGGAEKLPGRYTHIYFEYDYQDEWVFLSDLYYADIYDKNMVFSMVKILRDIWIMLETGTVVYKRVFDETINAQLFGSMMSALKTFSTEMSSEGLKSFELGNLKFTIKDQNEILFVVNSAVNVKQKKTKIRKIIQKNYSSISTMEA